MTRRTPKLAAELIGTFVLVFAGCGAIVVNRATSGAIGHAGIALTFGLVVTAMIYAFGDVSGAHFNPAVTLAFAAARRFALADVLPYVLAQCLGAIAACAMLWVIMPDDPNLGATIPAGAPWRALVLETLLTAILMLVVLSVSTGAQEKGITAGIAIGATVALEAMFAGPISGAILAICGSLRSVRWSAPWPPCRCVS